MDLKTEGLWDELLDEFQPEIVIQDWWVIEHPPHTCTISTLVLLLLLEQSVNNVSLCIYGDNGK